MVLPGIVARPSTCLRCQLLEVLLQARLSRGRIPARASNPYQRCNAFSTRSRRLQEADEGILVKKEKPYYWKKVKTPERVIGRPGRRQRVVSERLSTNSLDKPANVIVFKDVAEAPEAHIPPSETYTLNDGEPRPKALTAKEIEDAITGHYIAPAEAEVNLSIEGLRPQETVMNERDFEAHRRRLMDGYTFPQLSKYLAWSLRASGAGVPERLDPDINKTAQAFAWNTWRRGQTPLEQRHPKVVKKKGKGSTTKINLVEQVLRLAWHITIQSEQQEIGELEVELLPWQTVMLFDILQNDRPQYQNFIRSHILLDSTQVQPYPADSIMRVTGRRQDAEEVARQLKVALLKVERLEIDFKPFHDWEHRFSAEELGYISDLTKTVIAIEQDYILAVYGLSEAARHNARRLLLAMLDLPGKSSFDETSRVGTKAVGKAGRPMPLTKNMMPVDMSSGLHRRDRAKEIMRRMEPCQRKVASTHHPDQSTSSSSANKKIAKTVVSELAAARIPPSKQLLPTDPSDLYWRDEPFWTSWTVEFGKILQPQIKPKPPVPQSKKSTNPQPPAAEPRKLVLQHQVPGMQTLLSFFEDLASGNKMPYLIAHFIPVIPSVATSFKTLPRIQACFKFSTPQPFKPPELLLTSIIATIDEQHLSLPLTEHAVDLRFSRRQTLNAKVDVASNDEDIRKFSAKLQESVQRRGQLLDAPPELTFRLPQKFINRQASTQAVDVPYYFERFEQVQKTRFLPRQRILEKDVDEEVKDLVRSMPEDMLLDYGEVEGGAIYGSRTMLELRTWTPRVTENDESLLGDQVESESSVEPVEGVQSPPLDADTATVSKPSADGGEESQARTTHHGGENGPAARESASDVQAVEKPAESSKDPNAKTKELVSTALKIANILTRATSGSLKHYASQK
ncbi:hypothetical protein PRZ48_000340 [Zasmidium cellare]|uniref:Uncharacterized protein n=1 Tax=Zasmidium cellare TaxID=395010 RepID=A0ABR0EZU5_ZASCE|nr:hypothetical protein PRZ48_000340 [Zasmidium cellare]